MCTSMAARCWPTGLGANKLGAACALELILPQLGLRGGVHVDGGLDGKIPFGLRGKAVRSEVVGEVD